MSTTDHQIVAPTDDEVILYHQVWRALQEGSATRPAVPPELLLHIVALCGWVLPDHIRTEASNVSCYAYGGHKAERLWFTSEPLANEDLKRIAAIQLVTVGRDQGWADSPGRGSWSWFEVGIDRPLDDLVPEIRWESHRNELCGQKPTLCVGPLHPAPLEDWQPGDVVSVWACAQYPAWTNSGKAGELRFFKWFQPALSFSAPFVNTEDRLPLEGFRVPAARL